MQRLAGSRRRARRDVHDVDALPVKIRHATDLHDGTAIAHVHPSAEERTRLDRAYVRQSRERRQLSAVETQGTRVDRQVG